MKLASSTQRLFPHYDLEALATAEYRPFIIARLLEEGDSRDLRFLAEQAAEDELVEWLDLRGARQLSRRSLYFWRLVLGNRRQDVPADELWPL